MSLVEMVQQSLKGKRYLLRTGTLVLIERGETHEIRNTGKRKLRTLSVYVPPAYRKNGDPACPTISLYFETG
jgi:mannose-6-phosphate isomerase-like protein (cupin superfamily)